MDEKEYLQTLGEQIVNPHARASVLAEIQDHIEEQAQDYCQEGMTKEDAMKESIRQMGDPVSAGEALNQIHRPHFPVVLFGIAVVLTLFGIVMQYILYTFEPADTTYAHISFMQHTIGYNLIGFCIILLGIFGNYMLLSRYSKWLYLIFLALPLFLLTAPMGYYQKQMILYVLCLLYPFVYALLLYHFRENGWKAIVRLHLLSLLFFGLILTVSYGGVWPPVLAFVLLSLLLLGLCIQKGFLSGSKKILWCWTLLPYMAFAVLAAAFFLRPQTYLSDRLRNLIGRQNADFGPGYTMHTLHNEQTQFHLFGGNFVSDGLPKETLYTTYLLHSIFLWFGVIVGIAVIAALVFFALYGMRCALQQSNRLALLLGTAASGILLLELLNYVLTNFGVNLFYTASVPFLSYGLANTIANSILVGILLGIIRNRNVLSEYEPKPMMMSET